MNFKRYNLHCFSQLLFFLGLLFLVSANLNAQENPTRDNTTSLVNLKTMRALFPDIPVALSNELHGGLHAVQTIEELHGWVSDDNKLVLNDSLLQVGMLVYVGETKQYYRYKGKDSASGMYNDHSQSTTVNKTYWAIFPTEVYENVTVVPGCTNGYILNKITGKISIDGTANKIDATSGANTPGDHLILMSTSGTRPVDTYVWDGDDSAANDGSGSGVWRLVTVGTQVYESSTTQNWHYSAATNKFYADNTFTKEIVNIQEGDIAFYDGTTYVYDGDQWHEVVNQDQAEVILTDPSDPLLPSTPFERPTIKDGYDIGAIKKIVDKDESNCFVVWLLAEVPTSIDPSGTRWVEISRSITEKNEGHILGIRRTDKIDAKKLTLADFTKFVDANKENIFSVMPDSDVVLNFDSAGFTGEYFAFAVPSAWSMPKFFGHFDANDYYEMNDCWHKKIEVLDHVEYQIYVLDKKLPATLLKGGVEFCIE